MSVLKSLMGGSQVVGFYPNLARALGGAKAGLFFCQLSFWMGDAREVDRSGSEFEAATALTLDEQRGAREILLSKKAITITRRGVPARLFYQINWDVVEGLLSTLATGSGNSRTEAEIPEPVREIPELSIPRDPEKRKREKNIYTVPHRIPEDFSLSPAMLEYALKQGIVPDQVPATFDNFKTFYQGKGTKWLRWDICFQRWCHENNKPAPRDIDAQRERARFERDFPEVTSA